jgi:hypothetical protein
LNDAIEISDYELVMFRRILNTQIYSIVQITRHTF